MTLQETVKTEYSVSTTHKLIIGDVRRVLNDSDLIPNQSVDLIITSPPYGLGKNYGGKIKDKFEIDEWLILMDIVASQARRILTSNGSFFLNVSPIPERKTKEIIPLDSYAYFKFKEHGFYLRNKIIWHFHNMQNCMKRLSGRWEAILWFVKDINNYIFNLDAIRVPYLTNDKRIKGVGCNPTDVWYFDRVNNMTKNKHNINHPCVFPEGMIERIVKMSSNPGDTILDPFVGSGTTMRVAKILGRNSIGIEINPKYATLVSKRIEPENPTIFGRCHFEIINYTK
nr:site-specific DNA-methyltransferase [Candidatus Freyarchaeota archaeon]